MLVIIAWTATLSFLYFFIAKKVKLLRVSLLTEVIGLDICLMGARQPKSILSKVESRLFVDAGIVTFVKLQRYIEAELNESIPKSFSDFKFDIDKSLPSMSKPEVDKADESKEEEKPQPSAAIRDSANNPEVHQDVSLYHSRTKLVEITQIICNSILLDRLISCTRGSGHSKRSQTTAI